MSCRIGGVRPLPLPLDNFHVHWQTAEIISRMMRAGQFSPGFSTWSPKAPSFAKCYVNGSNELEEARGKLRASPYLIATHKQAHLVPDINSPFCIRSSSIVRLAISTYICIILVASRLVTLLIANLRRRLSHKYSMLQCTYNESPCILYNKFQRT